MNCSFCGKTLNVHVLDPSAESGGWQDRLYCTACRSFQALPGDAACLYCGGTYRHFLATGRLGCARCYEAFAADLEPLVERYRGEAAGAAYAHSRNYVYAPDRLAIARSEEVVRLVREAREELIESDATLDFGAPPANAAGRLPAERESPDRIVWYRVRVARNIAGLPYRLSASACAMLDQVLLAPAAPLAVHFPGGLEPPMSASALTREQAAGHLPRAARAAVAGRSGGAPEAVRIYTGDEDHLRIQWRGRTELSRLEDLAPRLDAILQTVHELNALYAFQYRQDYGFLTACPGIGGAGVRVSFLISVHNLVSRGLWREYERRLLQSGLEVRGSRGEEGGESLEFDGLAHISNRFWPAGLDSGAAIRQMLMIVRRIGVADSMVTGAADGLESGEGSENFRATQ